jgi:hypothetical protein
VSENKSRKAQMVMKSVTDVDRSASIKKQRSQHRLQAALTGWEKITRKYFERAPQSEVQNIISSYTFFNSEE